MAQGKSITLWGRCLHWSLKHTSPCFQDWLLWKYRAAGLTGVSEQILNGRSAQIGYTVRSIHVGIRWKIPTEDKSKTNITKN